MTRPAFAPLRSTLVKSIVGITGGAVIAQLVLILASVVIARLVTPSQFAQFAVSSGIAGILAAVLVASYPSIIPIARSEAESNRLAWLTLTVTLVLSLVAVIATELWFRVPARTSLFGLDHGLSMLTIAAAVSVAIWTLARALLVRHKKFRVLATTSVWGNVVQSVAQVAAAVLALGAAGLVFGYIAGRAINAAQMLRRQGLGHRVGLLRMRLEARRWGRLPIQLTVPILIGQITVWAVTPVVAGLYGDTFAGWFALAFRVLVIPLTLLGQSIATVVFPETAGLHAQGEDSSPVLVTTSQSLLTLGVPVFGTVVLLGPELFSVFFGQAWRPAGSIAAVLAPWMAFGLASSAISSFATVRQRFSQILAIGIVEGTLRVGALLAGHAEGSPMLGTALYSAAGTLIAITWIVWVLHEAATTRAMTRQTLVGPIACLGAACAFAYVARGHLTQTEYLVAACLLVLVLLAWAGASGRRILSQR